MVAAVAKQQEATEKPQPTPLVETLVNPLNADWQPTNEHPTFGGRVVFAMRYETVGDMPAMRRIYNGLINLKGEDDAPVVPDELKDDCSGLAIYLVLTVRIGFLRWQDHPELGALRSLWQWYIENANKPSPDYLELWKRFTKLGGSTMTQWRTAYANAQPSSLSADKALWPDELLTDEERGDPN